MTVIQTRLVKIKFEKAKDRDEFTEWAEEIGKSNTPEMKQMRNELDLIRKRRKAIVKTHVRSKN